MLSLAMFILSTLEFYSLSNFNSHTLRFVSPTLTLLLFHQLFFPYFLFSCPMYNVK